MTERPAPLTVFLVDDDASVRDSVSLLLGLHGHAVSVFASAEDFLARFSGIARHVLGVSPPGDSLPRGHATPQVPFFSL